MKEIGWIAALIAGFFVFSSFKKETTKPNTDTGDKTFSPAKQGIVNKDLVVSATVMTIIGGKPPVKEEKISANTKVLVDALTNGLYSIIIPDVGFAKVNQADISFVADINPVDIIDNTLVNNPVQLPPVTESNPLTTTGNTNAASIIDDLTGNSTNGNTPQGMPPNTYTNYDPPLYGSVIRNTGDGFGLWLKIGNVVRVYGLQKEWSTTSIGALVYTERYDVEYNRVRGFVQKETIQIVSGTFVTETVHQTGSKP